MERAESAYVKTFVIAEAMTDMMADNSMDGSVGMSEGGGMSNFKG